MTVPVPHTWNVGDDLFSADLNTLTAGVSFLENPPIAVALQTGGTAQSIPNATFTTVQWNQATIDSFSGFTSFPSTTYTVQVPGWYELIGVGAFSSASSTGIRQVGLLKNGSLISGGVAGAAAGTGAASAVLASITAQFNAGDTITLSVRQFSGAALNTGVGNTCSTLNIRWVHT